MVDGGVADKIWKYKPSFTMGIVLLQNIYGRKTVRLTESAK